MKQPDPIQPELSPEDACTQLRRFEVRSSEALLQLLDNGEVGLWEWNIASGENLVSVAWAAMLGYELSELQPTNYERFSQLIHPDDIAEVESNVKAHIEGKVPKYKANFRLRHQQGHWIWVKARGQITEWDSQGTPTVMSGIHLEITALKTTEETLRTRSITDEMTRWFNRGHFLHAGSRAVQRAQRQQTRLALIMFDIDHFKSINDSYGHATGDSVIQQVTQLVGRRVRSVDIAARMGGEEFAILLEGASLGDARSIAEQARKQISDTQFKATSGLNFHVTISFGVSMLQPEDSSIDSLLSRADSALYKAKTNGRNRTELA